MRNSVFVCLVLNFLLSFSLFAEPKKLLTLATTSWCPYTCKNSEQEYGFIGKYINTLLLRQGVAVKIESFPWSRAIKLAEQGKVDGLLTAIHSEAPFLIFTENPISTYQVCFYTLMTNQWSFDGASLNHNQTLGVIQDYGYGEPLDSFIEKQNNVLQIAGNNSSKRLLDMLSKGRVSIIAEDKLVLNWVAKREHIDLTKIRNAGCLPENPFYLALTKKEAHEELLIVLNKLFAEPKNILLLNDLVKH